MRSYHHRRSLRFRRGEVSLNRLVEWMFEPLAKFSVPAIEIEPVPANLNLNLMKLVPSWSTIGWIAIAGATAFCGAIIYQCVQNRALLDAIK